MTAATLRLQGPTLRRGARNAAQAAFFTSSTFDRWTLMGWALTARRLNLRTAHRRWLRRGGRNFTPPAEILRRVR